MLVIYFGNYIRWEEEFLILKYSSFCSFLPLFFFFFFFSFCLLVSCFFRVLGRFFLWELITPVFLSFLFVSFCLLFSSFFFFLLAWLFVFVFCFSCFFASNYLGRHDSAFMVWSTEILSKRLFVGSLLKSTCSSLIGCPFHMALCHI